MAAGAWTFTDVGRTRLLNGAFDIDTDSFKCALFLSTSNIGAAGTAEGELEIVYTAGGAPATEALLLLLGDFRANMGVGNFQ